MNTSIKDWLEGARVRTLPASMSPVFAGTGVAMWMGAHGIWGRAVLALLVSLCFQVGVNFGNDYSDGIRGTDDKRIGPLRLTISERVAPHVVRNVSFAFLALGCVFGLWLVAVSGHWWLLIVGAACVPAAWYYTGGKHPYGYVPLAEIFVFIFFGLVATAATTYVLANGVAWPGWVMACAMGFVSCGLLMLDNVRDIHTDPLTGKRTLAVHIGERPARWVFVTELFLGFVLVTTTAIATGWFVLIQLVPFGILAVRAAMTVLGHGDRKPAVGLALLPVQQSVGFMMLACGLGGLIAFGLASM